MDSPLSTLTDRERDVLLRVARGYQNDEIGRELEITAATVKVHLRNARLKLGGVSRGAAGRLVFDAAAAEKAGSTPNWGRANPFESPQLPPTATNASPPPEIVREAPVAFPELRLASSFEREDKNAHLSVLTKIGIVTAGSIAALMFLVLAKPVSDEFQRWATYLNRHYASRPR